MRDGRGASRGDQYGSAGPLQTHPLVGGYQIPALRVHVIWRGAPFLLFPPALPLRGENTNPGAVSSVGSQRLVSEFVRLTPHWPWSNDLLAQLQDWGSSTGHRSDVLE